MFEDTRYRFYLWRLQKVHNLNRMSFKRAVRHLNAHQVAHTTAIAAGAVGQTAHLVAETEHLPAAESFWRALPEIVGKGLKSCVALVGLHALYEMYEAYKKEPTRGNLVKWLTLSALAAIVVGAGIITAGFWVAALSGVATVVSSIAIYALEFALDADKAKQATKGHQQNNTPITALEKNYQQRKVGLMGLMVASAVVGVFFPPAGFALAAVGLVGMVVNRVHHSRKKKKLAQEAGEVAPAILSKPPASAITNTTDFASVKRLQHLQTLLGSTPAQALGHRETYTPERAMHVAETGLTENGDMKCHSRGRDGEALSIRGGREVPPEPVPPHHLHR